ncbi:MAG: hypothetical protein RRY64_00285 [Oscillospiraceae bacterium]
MKTYRNGIIIGLCLVFCLSVVTVTRSWFISHDEASFNAVTAGVVHYLPENPMSQTDMVLYGNLIGGNSVDSLGVSRVLPGDSLLPYHTVTINGTSATEKTVSSIVHPFNAGETPGSVIHREERTTGEGKTVVRIQRDLLTKGDPITQWYNKDAPGSAMSKPPTDADLGLCQKVTGTPITTVTEVPAAPGANPPTPARTETTVSLTTVYNGDVTGYTSVTTQTNTVTHETASFTGGIETEWKNSAANTPRLTSTESILYAGGDQKNTTSLLDVTYFRAAHNGEQPIPTPAVMPLVLGNCSTVPTNLRISATVTISSAKYATPAKLTFKQGTDANQGYWYAGTEVANVGFVELLRIKPAAGWTRATPAPVSPTAPVSDTEPVWELTAIGGTTVSAIPALPGGPVVSVVPVSPSVTPTPAPPLQPVRYAALDGVSIAEKSAFKLADSVFETKFKDLYCNDTMIEIKLSYFARQANYMEWNEFHSDRLTLKF